MSKLTRRLLCIGLVVVVMTALGILVSANFTPTTEDPLEPVCYEHGDVNGDGKVDNKDAIYIMYSFMFGDGRFPIEQAWDYNKDTQTNNKDAIYVMYHYMFQDNPAFGLDGTIHSYYDPTWAWDSASNTAQVTFKCGCGTPCTYTDQTGVTVTAGEVVAASCVDAGSETYIASITVDGKEYTNTYVKTLPAGDGHNMSGEPDCVNGSQCSLCDYSLPALGHSWELEETRGATCTANAVEVYRCSTCQAPNEVEQAGTAGHTLGYLEDRNDGCTYVKWYKCANCDHTEAGTAASDTYKNHTYTATLTTEANCVSAGVKTYACECGDFYTEDIPANNSHNWDEGEKVDDVTTTHTCNNTGCTATKTTVEVKENDQLSAEDLANELQLGGGASMSLDDDAVEGLGENKSIVVSVKPLEQDDALMDMLTPEQKEQIGDNTVYDFNMEYSNGEKISNFEGEVTISLPYTYKGEDVDSIDVWYIDDNGVATQVTGTYSNGFVTFTTNHFSYYTVTRLTPAERCSRYGHIIVTANKAATCTQDGFNMSVCQRCGHVEKDEVLTRKGHDYTQSTVAATCTEAGSFEKVCTRSGCGHKVTGVIPALRHDMQKDDTQTVEASCRTAGKTVYVCSHEGCEHKIESATAQLSHNYETVEVKAADCSNKGYTEKKCSLCEDTIYTDETLPLGHTYEVSGWKWEKDHLSAELTLACTNDASHIKTLSAVVTQKKESASCMGSGTVTFTATASFNQISYTDTYTQTTEAIGHKPGAQWESDGNRHYHICSVCSEPVDAVDHTWNDGTVTKEPTCNTAGSATYQCTVCQYEKEKTLPATKEHNYVSGVCSVCGKAETDCIHERVTRTEMDLTGWAVCEDSQIIKYSCDCGENVYYDWNLACQFSEESETKETIDYNGQQVVKFTRSCEDCDLSMSYFSFVNVEEDACLGYYAACYIINVPGQEPLVSIHTYSGEPRMHPGISTAQTLSLEEYGLCGEVLTIKTCGCEEQIPTTSTTETCKWEYTGEGEIYICADCGAKKVCTYDYEEPEDSCVYTELYTVTYYVNEVQVYTFTNRYFYAEHKYESTVKEMLGETCDEGLLLDMTCTQCGETRTVYKEYHIEVIEEVLDLSDANICYEKVVLTHCPCQENYQGYYFEGEKRCQWQWIGQDEETGAETSICRTCGAKRIGTYTESEKNENCVYVAENAYQFMDADGALLFTAKSTNAETQHNYTVEYTLKGETCQDGVIFKKTCVDCGEKYNYTSYYHETIKQQSYDLAQYGLCGGIIEKWGCPCGYTSSINWREDLCNWQQVAGDGDENMNVWFYRCSECDRCYKEVVERKQTEDPCVTERVLTYSFYDSIEANQLLLEVSRSNFSENHDMLTSLTLNDSELGCEGGYEVKRVCQTCGYTETWNRGNDTYHESWLIAKETYASEQMCGAIEKTVNSCACGKVYEENYNIWDNGCNWTYYGSGNGYKYVCEVCDTHCNVTNTYQPVEGEPCQKLRIQDIVFTNGETELFGFQLKQTEYTHRYVYTFQMSGTTCEEGVDASGTCLDCGATTWNWSSYCNTYPVERETIVDDEAACGVIDWVHYNCACGNRSSWDIGTRCSWEHEGYDQNGADMLTCSVCGMKWTSKMSRERIPGTCQSQVTRFGTFTMGEATYTYEKTYTVLEHTTVYDLTLLGETCADGVQITPKCAYCDYVGSSWTEYDHYTYRTQYYNLEDYGMCGGYVYNETCGCELKSRWYWSLGACDGRSTGTTDPDTGDTLWYCGNCENYYSWGSDGALNTETCTFQGEFYFKLSNAEQTLINVRGATSNEQHTTYVLSQELINPDGDCEDGVKRYWQCQYCDEGWYSTSYGHNYVEVDSVEAGCGGKIRYMSCVCGKNKTVYVENDCDGMTHEYYEKTDENGIRHYFTDRSCEDCGLRIVNEWYSVPVENCVVEETNIYTITGGDADKVFEYTVESTQHTNMTHTWTLAPGSESCDDGTICTQTCSACGYSDYWYSNGHSTNVVQTVQLSDFGACGGQLTLLACPCGQKQGMGYDGLCTNTRDSWETIGENGVTYQFTLRTCSECGLKEQAVTHKEATDTLCVYAYYTDTTVSIGDNQWSAQYMYTGTSHEWKVTYSLLEGSETCEDGLLAEQECTVCGQTSSWTTNNHNSNLVESVDLSQYSSVCGGSLDFYQCPCGANVNYSFNGNTCCDFDSESTSVWIEDAVYEYNPCIDDHWQTHQATLYRCAVTDPEVCGLVIRRANYCLKSEGCYVTRYVTFQIGYDEQTDTCQKEITYATGKKQFHNYTITSLDADAEDGSYTRGEHYVCADCQSEFYYKNEFDANSNQTRSESYYRNTLNDGYDQYRYDLHTYQLVGDTNYEHTGYHKRIYADGGEYWYQYVYTYDPENCTRSETYTNSNGETQTNEYEWHQNNTYHTERKDATCSQPGYKHYWYTCDRCGKTTSDNTYTYTPGHCWCWDDSQNTYRCCDCGLYCASGADGDVIMEDLTEEYGNGTEYVVGYYNPSEHMFVVNVSVILEDAQGEDDQIDLGITDIAYYTYDADGFTGLSVNKELADTAAAEAVAELGDYEGAYAIRISFVPISSSFTLDYAITFDAVTAE